MLVGVRDLAVDGLPQLWDLGVLIGRKKIARAHPRPANQNLQGGAQAYALAAQWAC